MPELYCFITLNSLICFINHICDECINVFIYYTYILFYRNILALHNLIKCQASGILSTVKRKKNRRITVENNSFYYHVYAKNIMKVVKKITN